MNKEIRYRVALFDSPVEQYTVTADTEDQAQVCENDPRFVQWLTGWERGYYEIKVKR